MEYRIQNITQEKVRREMYLLAHLLYIWKVTSHKMD